MRPAAVATVAAIYLNEPCVALHVQANNPALTAISRDSVHQYIQADPPMNVPVRPTPALQCATILQPPLLQLSRARDSARTDSVSDGTP